ncbi:Putative major facilitator superfamily, MFS transporter superfamily [Septoria linicola]|uniref:Major facilitator superfamily, MFS transporter superfamily n=1 Tax=Septoria linicola TaxID=215465 RepID=A0A9Q9EQ61_9PEZI|nr:Putative major facilitator superfamily, MFS transporter superfamily [Septoria linicola]
MSATQVLTSTDLTELQSETACKAIPLTNIQSPQARSEPGRALATDELPPRTATEVVPDGGYGWVITAACAYIMVLLNGYTTAWGVLQTAIVKSPHLHTDVQTITFVGGLYMACMVGFGLIAVRIMGKVGTRITCLVSALLFGVGLIATSFTLDHLGGLFCVAGLLLGVGTSSILTATNSLPLQYFSSKLGTANGIVKAGGGLGATIMPIAAQALLDKTGLAWTFRILGFLVLATAIPCALLLRDRQSGPRNQAMRYDFSILRHTPFLLVSLAGAIAVFSLYVPPFFLPLFASSIGLTATTGAGLVAGFGASTAVGRLLGGWVCDRMGALNTLTVACLVNSLTMLAIWPVSSSMPPLVLFAIVNGFANGSFFVALPTAVAALAPGSAAASISLSNSFWTPGYLLGPAVAGMLIDATGAASADSIEPYRAAIFYAAGTGVCASLLTIVARLKLDRKVIKKL